jgi:uncharacterized protein with PQ loop repeat
MPTFWILAVWSLAIFIGSVWGLLTTPSFNPALILAWLNQHSAAVQAVSAGLLVILTLALVLVTLAYAIFTNKLGNATDTLANIAGDQAKLLASGQRAYISVEPLGIGMVVGGARVLDRVGIHNAGRLPAHNLRWFIDIKASPNGVEKEFRIGELSGDVVAPSGVTMPRGTRRGMLAPELNAQSCSPVKVHSEESPVFLYVWGLVPYQDGLGAERWTRFCHRYNWVMRGEGTIGNYNIDTKYGRYHE